MLYQLKASFFLALSCLTITAQAYKNCRHTDTAFRCVKYINNYDGDTITVQIPNIHPLFGFSMKVRLNGIDTPEIRGSKACEKKRALYAKEFVGSLLKKAQSIELKKPARGKYFRILADLWFDGVSLKDLLLEKKLAIPYDGGKKPEYDWCHN